MYVSSCLHTFGLTYKNRTHAYIHTYILDNRPMHGVLTYTHPLEIGIFFTTQYTYIHTYILYIHT